MGTLANLIRNWVTESICGEGEKNSGLKKNGGEQNPAQMQLQKGC